MAKLSDYLGLAVWGELDAAKIARLSGKIKGISVLPKHLAELKFLNGTDIKLFVMSDHLLATGWACQYFTSDFKTPQNLPNAILSLSLTKIESLDWEQIIEYGKNFAGFFLIDESGQNLHKFYDFLTNLPAPWTGEIQYFSPKNPEPAFRLVKQTRPDLLPKLLLFAQNLDFLPQT